MGATTDRQSSFRPERMHRAIRAHAAYECSLSKRSRTLRHLRRATASRETRVAAHARCLSQQSVRQPLSPRLVAVPAGAARDKVISILHPQVLHPDKVWPSIMYRGSSFLLPCFEHYQLFRGLNSVTRRVTKVTQTGLGFPVECAILQSARCWADYRKLGAMVHDRSLRPWLQNSALS